MNRSDLLLYAITDRGCIGKRDFYKEIENALRGGVTILQLREKGASTNELIKTARSVKEICAGYNVPLIVNDNVTAAIESGADGVHVGAEDMDVQSIRQITGKDFIVGATAKTLVQAQNAVKAGADYLGCGAIFPSSTKDNAKPMSIDTLKEIVSAVSVPVVAIGGITYENADILKGSGVSGIAVVSSVFAADNVMNAASELRKKCSCLF